MFKPTIAQKMLFTIRGGQLLLRDRKGTTEVIRSGTLQEAFLLSLTRWVILFELNRRKPDKSEPIGDENAVMTCALCVFCQNRAGYDEPCGACPIFQKTGRGYCAETPFFHYRDAGTAGEAAIVAEEELDFLWELYEETFPGKVAKEITITMAEYRHMRKIEVLHGDVCDEIRKLGNKYQRSIVYKQGR